MQAQCKTALHSPLKGKYLIQNGCANWMFRLLDAGLSACTWKRKRNFPIPVPEKILFSNLAHLGDVILATSLLPIVKRVYPRVRIGMIIGSWASKIIENHPYVDFIHLFDHWKVDRSDSRLWRKIQKTRLMSRKVLQELKEIKYDIFIECSFHFPNAIFLSNRAKIPVRIGYVSGGRGPLLTHPVLWKEGKGSASAYGLALLEHFMPINDVVLKSFLPCKVLAPPYLPERYLVVHMGSGHPIKAWPLEKWKKLCAKLTLSGYFLIFTGKGRQEFDVVESVINGLKNCQNLCDELSWEEYVAVIRGAQVLVGVDTSAGHIAAAMDTPSVLIYTGIHPIELWKPLNERAIILMNSVPCYPCHRGRGCLSMDCIRNVGVDEVFAAIKAIEAPASCTWSSDDSGD